jgi:hypothetical protein
MQAMLMAALLACAMTRAKAFLQEWKSTLCCGKSMSSLGKGFTLLVRFIGKDEVLT